MAVNFVKMFNDQFTQFVDDIQRVFPDDVDIATAKNALLTIRKANPKLLVKIWVQFVAGPYRYQIEAGDINFFINKDYAADVSVNENADKIMQSIDRLRNPVKEMSTDNQAKAMKYIQNLTKLSLLVQ